MSIYVVDDHPIMRDAIAMVMRRLQPHRNMVAVPTLMKQSGSDRPRSAGVPIRRHGGDVPVS
jgi:hypothetical protein